MHWLWENLPILLVWLTFGWQVNGIVRRRRRQGELVDVSGLTPLQVQVAMDAAMAVFCQRVEEMRAMK